MKRNQLALVAALGASLFTTSFALADPESDKRIAAEALFQDAKKLIDAGRFGEACPKLAESHRLAPGIGVLMNLGACYERTGLVASAWAALNEAADRAKAAGDGPRETLARDRAKGLEARLPKLSIDVKARTPGLVVERDGSAIAAALYGQAIPVDPGDHVVAAKAPGFRDWSARVSLLEGKQQTVTIDVLTALPKTAPLESKGRPSKGGSSGRLPLALALGGVGLAGFVVGTATGLAAVSKMGDAKAMCLGPDQRSRCPAEALSLQDQAKPLATVSTVGFIVGGMAVAADVTIWIVGAARDEEPSSALSITPGGLSFKRFW